MHELPTTQSILDLVLAHASRAGAQRVTDVHLVVGDLSRIVDESVQFYWDILSQGTVAEAARLHFTRVPLRLDCRDCRTGFEPDGVDYRCPGCAGTRVHVVAGDEFRVDAIDVDMVADPLSETRRS